MVEEGVKMETKSDGGQMTKAQNNGDENSERQTVERRA